MEKVGQGGVSLDGGSASHRVLASISFVRIRSGTSPLHSSILLVFRRASSSFHTIRCAMNSSLRTEVLASTSTRSMAMVGTCANITLRMALATLASVPDNVNAQLSSERSVSCTCGFRARACTILETNPGLSEVPSTPWTREPTPDDAKRAKGGVCKVRSARNARRRCRRRNEKRRKPDRCWGNPNHAVNHGFKRKKCATRREGSKVKRRFRNRREVEPGFGLGLIGSGIPSIEIVKGNDRSMKPRNVVGVEENTTDVNTGGTASRRTNWTLSFAGLASADDESDTYECAHPSFLVRQGDERESQSTQGVAPVSYGAFTHRTRSMQSNGGTKSCTRFRATLHAR